MRNQIQRTLTETGLRVKNLLFYVSIRLGKTKIALDAIEPGDKVLWVYPSNAMLSGYQEDLLKFPPLSTDITFTNISSIKKFKNTHWDMIVVDEPQRCKSIAQIKALKTITFNKRFGLSGTMNKKTLTVLKDELNWNIGATYSLEDGIRDGIVKNYKVFIYFVDLCNTIKTIPYKNFGRDAIGTEKEVYESYCKSMIYFEEQEVNARIDGDIATATRAHWGFMKYMGLRTNLLYNSQCLLVAAEQIINRFRDRKALIYTLRTDVADKLSTKSFHSKNKLDETLEWFRNSTNGHCAACDCITTGVTIKNLNTVIFHSYDSNTENFHQKLGRSLLYENPDETAEVHVAMLRGTQNEKWIESACSSLEIEKINYVVNGITYRKIDWIKSQHPDKKLFLVKGTGQVIYFVTLDEQGNRLYSYLNSPNKTYNFSSHKLTPII